MTESKDFYSSVTANASTFMQAQAAASVTGYPFDMNTNDFVATVRLSDPSGGIRTEDVRAAIEKALRNPETGLLGMNLRVTVEREPEGKGDRQ